MGVVDAVVDSMGDTYPELLERRRGDYLAMRDHLPHFAVVDAGQPLDRVKAEAEELIRYFAEHGGLPDGR